MSYYVTITRNPSPNWHSRPVITEAEWREVALAEPGIRPPCDSDEGGEFNDPGDLIWTGHPEYPEIWLDWFDGQVDVKGPDEFTLALMARLAAKLNANLIGEDGQRFDSSGKSLGVSELPEEPDQYWIKKTPWWQGIVEGLKSLWPGRRKQWWEDRPRPRWRVARWR